MGMGMGTGMGMGMGPMGGQMGGDPNDPNNLPPQQPPASWMVLLQSLGNIVGFFSRISFLVAANTEALTFFMTALLQVSWYSRSWWIGRTFCKSAAWFAGASGVYSQFILKFLDHAFLEYVDVNRTLCSIVHTVFVASCCGQKRLFATQG